MKPRTYLDLGTIFDELFNAADEFRSELHKNFSEFSGGCAGSDPGRYFNENTDYYPGFSYPPMNVFLTGDKSLIFEFALAGFDERNIYLSFQGDYMIFSARIENEREAEAPENIHYLKRRLKFKDIDMQKYYVPLDKYAQENVRAVFKNGILRVTIPPKPEPDQNAGVRIDILKEGT
ncbi:MAG: Hsp20/alpha crystallin family protein [Spirochaetaceae bacterium]|jgi:HSP20 family molecular chaperone IbpA|nr:Hsp20/alpha crystallin family protein [Spirochaetaceae bacterium]